MTEELSPDLLRATLQEALDLLEAHGGEAPPPDRPAEPLPSLLAQCEALCRAVPPDAPVRSLHHFACSGGTLISKAVALMPNVTLLSEIDPLSPMTQSHRSRLAFAPSDLIYAARTALRPVGNATITAMFDAAIGALYRALSDRGRHLVLRDHAHSQFCTAVDFDDRPTLREILRHQFDLRSVVTVRHPLESYLSLHKNGWASFSPSGLEEYCRRYMAFLDRHAELPLFRYEDFVADPEPVLREICAALDLPFAEGFEDLLGAVHLSGDSGRRSDRIAPRPRRPVPEDIQAEAGDSAGYVALCDRLGYSPDTQ